MFTPSASIGTDGLRLDDTSGDFVVNNTFAVFASDVDSKYLINNEKIIFDETTDTHKYVI